MKVKKVKLKGEKKEVFLRLIASQYNITSEREIDVLRLLVLKSMFTPFYLDKYTKSFFVKELNITESTFVVMMHRLISKGAIAKNQKSYYLNVAFRGLDEVDCIMFGV
jgi:predicted transcriptional regulator